MLTMPRRNQEAINQELQREQEALRAAAAASAVVWYQLTHPSWAASAKKVRAIPFWQIATIALFFEDPSDWRVRPYVSETTQDSTTVLTLAFPDCS